MAVEAKGPSPVDLPDPGIEPRSPILQADSLLSEPPGKPHYNLVLANLVEENVALPNLAFVSFWATYLVSFCLHCHLRWTFLCF